MSDEKKKKDEKEENIHKGHRRRLKARFLEYGLENFNEINALELLLFYAIPQQDVNPLAHKLLERFGSLNGVFEASLQELLEMGVTENQAGLLCLVPQIMKHSMVLKAEEIGRRKGIHNVEDAGAFLLPKFDREQDEVVYLICLDSKRKVIRCDEMGRGVVNSVQVSVRRMVETALRYKASSVILAHNHPDGYAIPSREDDAVTQQVAQAFDLVGIPLADHIIIAGDDFVSYCDSGLLWSHAY